jgi:hypothetical protein
VWQASVGQKEYFVAPHILEDYSKMPSGEHSYCLRLSYSQDLKTRNNHGSWSVGIACHSFWVGDSHEKWLWKGDGSDVDPLRNISSGELG